MSEGRRRQIIRSSTPEESVSDDAGGISSFGSEAEDWGYEPPGENILKKTVFIPLPLILAGFLGVIILSFSVTYIVVRWPAGDLDLPENQAIQTYREAIAETTLEFRQAPTDRAEGVDFPEAEVDVPSLTARAFSPETTPEVAEVRGFQRSAALEIAPPVADLGTLETPNVAPTRVAGVPLPQPRPQAPGSREVLSIEAPAADIELPSFQKEFVIEPATTASQKLMARRYANGAENPVPPENLDIITLPRPTAVEGVSVAENTTQIPRAAPSGSPVGDLGLQAMDAPQVVGQGEALNQKLMQRRYAQGTLNPEPPENLDSITLPQPNTVEGISVAENTTSIQRALPSGTPVNDLQINTSAAPETVGAAEPLDQKLMARRFAQSAGNLTPVADLAFARGEIPVITPGRQPVEENQNSFAAALGVNSPVADLQLQGAKNPNIVGEGDAVNQRLMSRRYATAVAASLPERLPPENPIGVEPNPVPLPQEPILEADQSLLPWQRFAAAVPPNIGSKGRVVIVIDDMGNNSRMSERMAGLGGPMTFAFLPYAPNLSRQTSLMRRAGHELIVHMPMEPRGDENPGPGALTTSLNDTELMERLNDNLSSFDAFVGVNNHMGSAFTADRHRMDIVMRTLKERGLLFLDSVTTSNSQGASLARAYDIPWAGRDIFIDNEIDEAAILAQLQKVERLADQRGIAIAIGHPHAATYRALQQWIPTLEGKGLVLVPLSSVVRQESATKLAGGSR